jgi:hypothetical protein
VAGILDGDGQQHVEPRTAGLGRPARLTRKRLDQFLFHDLAQREAVAEVQSQPELRALDRRRLRDVGIDGRFVRCGRGVVSRLAAAD